MDCPFKSRAALALGIVLGAALQCAFAADDMISTNDDPYLWLENVTGDKALDWVRAQNAVSTRKLESSPGFAALQERLLAILNSRERIPYVAKHGKFYYNFWRDDKNTRGLWRRTTLEEYKKPDPAWETVLDLDQLAARKRRTGSGTATRCWNPAMTVACWNFRAAAPTRPSSGSST